MAKLRKMLGKADDPQIIEMMRVIETQSKSTLTAWAVAYVEEHYLGIYKKESQGEEPFSGIIAAVRECLNGEMALKNVKPFLREANQVAKEADKNPLKQAAARAIATACAVIQTPTSALGFAFYGAAAFAYDQAGLEERQEVYDALAMKELDRILESLKKATVADEANPVKVNWNC